MKIELEKTKNIEDHSPWYRILIDDRYIHGSYDFEEIEKLYEHLKTHPEEIIIKKEILKSEEI